MKEKAGSQMTAARFCRCGEGVKTEKGVHIGRLTKREKTHHSAKALKQMKEIQEEVYSG